MPDQHFDVKEDAPAGKVVGNMDINASTMATMDVQITNNISEFKISSTSPYEITVANGAKFDYKSKNQYKLLVVAKADMSSSSASDTTIVVINILPTTPIIEKALTTSNLNFVQKNGAITFDVGIINSSCSIYDVNGRKVATLKPNISNGRAFYSFRRLNLSKKIYFVRIMAGNISHVEKIIF